MKYLSFLLLGTCFFTGSIQAEGLGINLGPFSLQFNVGDSYYADDYDDVLDSPICFAITNRKRLGIILESKEKINTREIKISTKKLVIEPYAFGITKDGKPVLNGNIISENLIKEVTVKFGEDQVDNTGNWSNKSENGFFSGLFKSDKSQTINIEKVSNLYVMSKSTFDAPKNYKGIKDENIRIICELPIENRN